MISTCDSQYQAPLTHFPACVHSLLWTMDGTWVTLVSLKLIKPWKSNLLSGLTLFHCTNKGIWPDFFFLTVLNLQIIRLPKLSVLMLRISTVLISSSSSYLCPHGSLSVRPTYLKFQPKPLHVCMAVHVSKTLVILCYIIYMYNMFLISLTH